MYRNTPRKSGSPRHGTAQHVDDGPIADFVKVIDNTPAGAWQKRTTAFENLMKQIPENHKAPPLMWYNNPPTLRHLANPISELLKDPRSTVVKRTCGSLLSLFTKAGPNAKYLFKDLMATVLSVHAQTVQVIRQAVQYMIMEAIPEVPCKMVMPLWMERLKIDKSRTVRDACAVYLGHALQCWDEIEGYLSEEIWMSVGRTLIGSLRDPSPNVRNNSKNSLENFQRMQPMYWDKLINDPDGPAARDAKLQAWLHNLGTGNNPDTEELSIVSRFSYNSGVASRGSRAGSVGRAGSVSSTPRRGVAPSPRENNAAVPASIALGRRSSPVNLPPSGNGRASKSGLPQPTRRSDLLNRLPATPSPQKSTGGYGHDSPMGDSVSPMASPPAKGEQRTSSEMDGAVRTSSGGEDGFPSDLGVPGLRETMNDGQAAPSPSKAKDPSNVVESMSDVEKFSKRRNRNSVLIQQRLRMSSSSAMNYDDDTAVEDLQDDPKENVNGQAAGNAANNEKSEPAQAAVAAALTSNGAVPPPEHMVIAIRLLKAHKAHVDAIMETLRIEMDTLRDFDRLLEEPGRPTEEEVLDYFESVGLCLEQRTVAGVKMQEELDRVSRGEPPAE